MIRAVATILIPIIFSCCRSNDDQAEFWRNEREKTELTHRLQLAEYRLSLTNTHDPGELESLRALVSEMEVKLWNLQSDRSALVSEIARMEEHNRQTAATALNEQREKNQGKTFETLSAKNGRVYQNAKIVRIDDSGVLVRHKDGVAVLRYADLSEEQRHEFGMDEATALAAEEAERKDALRYEQAIDTQMAEIRKQEELASADQAARTESRALRTSVASNYRPREPSILSQPARPFGTGSIYRRSYRYDTYGRYRSAYRYVYVYPQSSNPFCASRAPQSFSTNSISRSPIVPSRPCPAPAGTSSAVAIPIAP